MGTRITPIDDLIGKAAPVERHGLPKGMVRLRSTGSFRQKGCFYFAADFDPSSDERNYLPLSVGVMLDISGSSAEACVSSQHLDIPLAAANLTDPPRCTRD